jgi:hypothetical protein
MNEPTAPAVFINIKRSLNKQTVRHSEVATAKALTVKIVIVFRPRHSFQHGEESKVRKLPK